MDTSKMCMTRASEDILDTVEVTLLKVLCKNRVSNPGPLYLELSALLLSYSCHEALQLVVVVVIMV